MDTKCKFKLKGDSQVTVSALGGKTMTNHNITDDMAIAFLSTNVASRVSFFETLSDDYEKEVKKYLKPTKEVKKAPVKKVSKK